MNSRLELFELYNEKRFSNVKLWNESFLLVDNVWKKLSESRNSQVYECKFGKLKKSQNNVQIRSENVDCPAKMIVQHENESVLVQKFGSWASHSHSLDMIDHQKACSFIPQYIRSQSENGYDADSIHKAFHKKFEHSNIGAKFVSLQKCRGYISKRRRNFVAEEEIETFFKGKSYNFEKISHSTGLVHVFATTTQLKNLVLYGNKMILMDACFLKANCYIVTLLIRNKLRCWLPAAQFFVTAENHELYCLAFNRLLVWTTMLWKPEAILIDGSAVESKAIQKCFPNAFIGTCTRHSLQTLRLKLSHVEEVFYYLERALFAETAEVCSWNIMESIKRCPYDDLKRYIRTKWNPVSSARWSIYSRLFSPVLREVTTINACESYHALIRKVIPKDANLLEISQGIGNLINRRYNSASEAVSLDKEMTSDIAKRLYPQIKSWPLSYQLLLRHEVIAAEKLVSENTWKYQWFQANDDHTCRCRFYASHLLPCRHIFIVDLIRDKDWVPSDKWDEWKLLIMSR
jgi:hypothetical protein